MELKGRDKEQSHSYAALPQNYLAKGESNPLEELPAPLKQLPTVVLVDHGTEGAAEIVAAALQDNRRARIIGHPTLGRGWITTPFTLKDGARVNLTTATILRPSGQPLTGVVPDVLLDDAGFIASLGSPEDAELAVAAKLLQLM